MRPRLPRYAAFVALATSSAALVPSFSACAASEGPRRGGLVVTVVNDGSLDTDLLKVRVSTGADQVLLQNEYRIPETNLPNQLSIVSNGSPTTTATIVISAWKNGVPVDRRDAIVTQIPSDRVASLVLTLSARCTPLVRLGSDGTAESLCGTGETCDPSVGACADASVSATTLPDYENDQCIDGGCVSSLDSSDDDAQTFCPANQLVCGGTCTPILTDNNNCGRCGRSCGGTACGDGRCEAVVLISRAADAGTVALAVDETDVYFGESTGVFKMPSGGGSLSQFSDAGAVQISLSAANVYWLTSNVSSSVFGRPKDGGSQGTYEQGSNNVSSIVGTDDYVYVAHTQVFRRDREGGVPISMQPGRLAYDPAGDGGYIFGSHAMGLDRGAASSQFPSDAGTRYVDFGGSLAPPTSPFVANGQVYWAQFPIGMSQNGVIRRAPAHGGHGSGTDAAVDLATMQSFPVAVAADATNIYWIGQNSPNLMSVPIAGGTPKAVLTNLVNPIALAIDSRSIYFIDTVAGGEKRIMKVAKP